MNNRIVENARVSVVKDVDMNVGSLGKLLETISIVFDDDVSMTKLDIRKNEIVLKVFTNTTNNVYDRYDFLYKSNSIKDVIGYYISDAIDRSLEYYDVNIETAFTSLLDDDIKLIKKVIKSW